MILKYITAILFFGFVSSLYSETLVYRFDGLDFDNVRREQGVLGSCMTFDKYIYNGDIIEFLSLKRKNGISLYFSLNTTITIEKIIEKLNKKTDYATLMKFISTFSDGEFSDKLQVTWLLLIKDQTNKYKPVILRVRFAGDSVDNYVVDDYDIFVGST